MAFTSIVFYTLYSGKHESTEHNHLQANNIKFTNIIVRSCIGGTRYRSWLRHFAQSRKVAGSIPDCVIGIFH